MLKYILLTVVCVGMMLFSLGAVYLSTEEKNERSKI